jgi:molybdopterin-biosynthesis enzyme MoeA-like protein
MIVFETPESALVPLMQRIEAQFAPVKAFSLPSVGDGRDGRMARRHIELGVKGPGEQIEAAFRALHEGVVALGAEIDAGEADPQGARSR